MLRCVCSMLVHHVFNVCRSVSVLLIAFQDFVDALSMLFNACVVLIFAFSMVFNACLWFVVCAVYAFSILVHCSCNAFQCCSMVLDVFSCFPLLVQRFFQGLFNAFLCFPKCCHCFVHASSMLFY